MAQSPSNYINNPVSGAQYWSQMWCGCIANSGTSVTVTVKAWSGNNGTGSLVLVSNLRAIVWNQTANASQGSFSGNFNTVNASHTAGNSTDWYKASGQYTGSGVGSLEFYVTYTGSAFVPNISSFTPAIGSPGTSVSISGSRFTDATTCDFNGTAASFTVNGDSSITATVPSGATAGPIHIGNPAGTGASSTNFQPGQVWVSTGGAPFIPVAIWYGDSGGTPHKVAAIYIGDSGGVPRRRW